jgi:adenylate cyclase
MSDPLPLFGDLMIRLGVRREQLQSALLEAVGLSGIGPAPRQLLGELLIRLKHATVDQVRHGLEVQNAAGRRLGEVMVELRYCTYDQIYEALSLQSKRTKEEEEAASPIKIPRKRKVMVVDDSPISCSLVEGGLIQLGYEVVAYNDPFLALENVFKQRPALVLSDLEMPGMDGNELCRRLKDGPARNTPVIILTANDAEAQRIRGLRAGADDYVSKSASLEEIAARIESVLRRTGETDRIRKLFVRYTSDAVVDEILKNPDEVILTGEKREVTVLFADLRNFTSLAESLPAEAVVNVLNGVLGPLAEAVLTCGGTLDKFLGDGLMAVFGAPVRRADDALRAVQAAGMMMESVDALNEKNRGGQVGPLLLGIGINSGPAVVGTVGSEKRTEYTCIGDTVNVAARLCAVAGGREILAGARTQELAKGNCRFEPLEPVQLKGKSHPVPVFRALWKQETAEPAASAKAKTPP